MPIYHVPRVPHTSNPMNKTLRNTGIALVGPEPRRSQKVLSTQLYWILDPTILSIRHPGLDKLSGPNCAFQRAAKILMFPSGVTEPKIATHREGVWHMFHTRVVENDPFVVFDAPTSHSQVSKTTKGSFSTTRV